MAPLPRDIHEAIQGSSSYLKQLLKPIDDLLGSAAYKLYITGVLLERALQDAVQDAVRRQDQKND